MATKKDFQIDRRVGIALDALSASQKAALKPMLETKEGFVAHAKLPGTTKRLSTSKPLYSMKVGGGMRIIFTMQDNSIVVQDIMRKATMDHFLTKRSGKTRTMKTGHGTASVKPKEAVKSHKV